MYGLRSIFLITLATTVSAAYLNGELLRRELLNARQAPATATATATASTNSTAACSSVLQGLATLFTGLPVPTGPLSTYLATAATTLTDPCHLSVPTSIASEFSVYESSVISFYNGHSSQLNSALLACPSLTSLIANPVCSTSTAGTVTAVATRNATSSAVSATSPPATVSTAGANGEGRMVAAGLAAAGVLGAVIIAL